MEGMNKEFSWDSEEEVCEVDYPGGKKMVVRLNMLRGVPYIDIRQYMPSGVVGEMMPTRKGVVIRLDKFIELLELMRGKGLIS